MCLCVLRFFVVLVIGFIFSLELNISFFSLSLLSFQQKKKGVETLFLQGNKIEVIRSECVAWGPTLQVLLFQLLLLLFLHIHASLFFIIFLHCHPFSLSPFPFSFLFIRLFICKITKSKNCQLILSPLGLNLR